MHLFDFFWSCFSCCLLGVQTKNIAHTVFRQCFRPAIKSLVFWNFLEEK